MAGVLLTTVIVVAPASSVLAASSIDVGKSAPGQILAGKNVPYTLNARNTGTTPLYNLTFRDVLPLGVTYVAPTTPADAGEPEIIVNQVPDPLAPGQTMPQQTLLWSNVGDLQVGDNFTLGFAVALNATPDPLRPSLPVYQVGSIVNNSASGFASPDPRVLQSFTATGEPIANPNVQTDTAAGQPTVLTAIEIRKSEPSPEGELLRGVHDHDTVYTLAVEVTGQSAVNGVTVTDYLPAALEFLGCGGVDNTPPGPRRPEYAGAALLSATPTPPGCVFPTSVDTVVDPPPQGSTSYPAGVYTKLTWNLGARPAGSIIQLPYAAGIPLNANAPFAAPVPPPTSGLQASNLGNNTGASTREGTTESAVTNVARAEGVYQGTVAAGASKNVFDDTRLTRTIEDVRIRKSIRQPVPNVFRTGGIAVYDITVDVSEYVNATGVVLTDLVPNGMCPLGAISYPSTDNPGTCGPLGPGNPNLPSLPFASVVPTPGGGFTTVFTPLPADQTQQNDSTVVTYSAYMRGAYEGGPNTARPPVSGDTFTNTVTSSATTTPIPGTPETGAIAGVTDGSSATLVTDSDAIDKLLRPRDAPRLTPGEPCPGVTGPIAPGEYIDSNTVGPSEQEAKLGFRLGDEVCFLLTVNFDPSIKTKNAFVTDFLPPGVKYVGGSLSTTVNNVRVNPNFTPPADPAGPLEFPLGSDDPAIPGTDRFVDLAATFQVVFKGVVVDIPDNGVPTVTGNLMKMRTENSGGQVRSYRDRVPLGIVPAPPVQIQKGVASVDNPPFSTTLPNQDGKAVQENSTATFRIDVTNNGSSATFTDYSVRGLDVWDVLPAGITCAQISGITAFDGASSSGIATCTNPGQTGHPTFTGNGKLSAIRWVFPVDPANPDVWRVNVGQTRTVTYQMRIPTPTSVATNFVNNSAIRSFDAFTNVQGKGSTYFPADNIDTSVTPAQENADSADDPSNVFTPGARTTKVGTTGITEAGNDTPVQAVPGETITYTYGVEIPPNTSVFSGVLRDILPTQLEVVSPAAVARFYPDATSSTTASLPAGFPSPSPAADGTLTFPATYTNSTALTQRFEVVLTTRVKPTVTGQVTITDTARFTSLVSSGGAPVVTPDSTYTNSIRQANPSISKSNNAPAGSAVGGQTVQYTLVGRNSSGRPPLHDAVLSDCIPAGLTFATFGASTPGGSTTGPLAGNPAAGANGCPTGTTYIAFAVGTIAPGGSVTRTYTATVNVTAIGGDTYTNTARIVGSSLNNGVNDPLIEAVYRPAAATNTVTVPGADSSKSVTPSRATIGEFVTYKVSVTSPINTNFYQSALRDRLPVGIDPASVEYLSADCQSLPNASVPAPPSCDAPTVFFPTEPAVPATSPVTYVTGVFVGDLAAAPYERRITVQYRARLADVPSNVAGATVSNQAQAVWDASEKPDPTSANYKWDRAGTPRSADVRVLEPKVTVAKVVSDTNPDPGDLFTYTLTLANANGTFVSPAYNATVVDVLPAGVDVIESTIDPVPSSFTAPTATAAGQIVWDATLLAGPLDPGATQVLTYQARLFPSPDINATAKPNTVNLQRYEGLPAGVDAAGNRRIYSGNTATASVAPQFPKLSIVKTALDGEPTYIGTNYSWRIRVTNTGTAPAFGVSIEDQLPTNWTYVANSSVFIPAQTREPILGTGGVCPVGRNCWLALGRLDPGQSLTLTYQAVPGAAVVTSPGVGSSIRQVNTAASNGFDATAATGNLTGPYGTTDVNASTRIDKADLVLDKSSTGSAVAGKDFSWLINVRNKSGVDTAVGPFVVTDTLPAGVTLRTASGTGWTCTSPTSSTVTCQRTIPSATLAAGAAFPPITVTVGIPADFIPLPDLTRSITNTASVTMKTYEQTPADNTDSDTVSVGTQADLQIVKNRTAPIVAGLNTTFTLSVSNLGPSVSRAPITVRDPVPANVTFVSATAGAGWSPCGLGTGADANVVVCTYNADLAVGAVAPQIALTVAVGSGITGDVTNTATVTGTTPDPVPGNNTSTVPGAVGTQADLRIDKQATGVLVAGQQATYRLRVDNDGPSDAVGVSITDPLPNGLTFVGSTSIQPASNGWVCTPGAGGTSFTCTLPSLAAGQFATVDVIVQVPSGVTDAIVNTATVTAQTPDPDLSNNSDKDESVFGTNADLKLVKSSSGAAVAGRNFTWTLQVSNLGPSDSQPVITVTDRLPVGTEFVSAGGGTGTEAWTCPTPTGGVVTCTRSVPLVAAGVGPSPDPASIAPPIELVVRVLPDAGPGTLTNFASVKGVTNDPDLANNDDSNPVVVTDLAELSIDKATTGANPATAGTQTAYTIIVTNDGPSVADNVVVSDVLPAGLTAASVAAGTGWLCAPTSGPFIVCSRNSLAPGAAPPIVVTVDVSPTVPDNTTITNTARVSTATPESGTRPNEDSSDVLVLASADVSIVKTHTGAVRIGSELAFKLGVANSGPSQAIDVVVADTFPAGLTPLRASGTGWTCTVTGQDVACTLAGPLGPLGTAEITVTALVGPAAFPQAINVATVDSGTPDPQPDNNRSTDPVDVPPLVDLTIAKVHTGPVKVGQPILYTLTVGNNGPIDDAAAITVVDDLPASLTPTAAVSADAVCAIAGQKVTCTKADGLGVGATFKIAVTATVLPSAYPSVANTAKVSSPTDDLNPANNSATDTATVPPLVDLTITKTHADPVAVGGTITYTLVATNAGPTPDPGPIMISDALPASLAPVSAAGPGLTCTIGGQNVLCVSQAPLAPGASLTATIVANVLASAAPSVTNTAIVETPSPETNTGNNQATDVAAVQPLIKLRLTKTLASQVGLNATWAFDVANVGLNATLQPIVLTDALPSGLVYVSASGQGWDCSNSGNVVTCSYPATVQPGTSAPLLQLVTVVVAAPGQVIVNVASVEGGGPNVPPSIDNGSVTAPTPGGGLPATGSDPSLPLRIAPWLIAVGLVLLVGSSRRRNPERHRLRQD